MRPLGPILALTLASGLAACGRSDTAAPEAAAPQAAPPAASAEDQAKQLASLPAPYNGADVARGQTLFGVCRSCHTIAPGGANLTGPNLHGVFGRAAASVPGYNYSAVLKGSGIVWEPQRLDEWLANPRTFLPGTKMSFAGMKNPQDRTDVIAYLMIETATGG